MKLKSTIQAKWKRKKKIAEWNMNTKNKTHIDENHQTDESRMINKNWPVNSPGYLNQTNKWSKNKMGKRTHTHTAWNVDSRNENEWTKNNK